MSTRIQLKRGTSTSWTSADPILSQGEMGYETDTKRIKVGDGTNAWSTLPYSFFGVSSYVQSVGDGSSTSITVTHNLKTRNVLVSVKDSATYTQVMCDVTASSINAVTLGFATAPTSGQYIVTILADGVPVNPTVAAPGLDTTFSLAEANDNTKTMRFNLSAISTGSLRTLTVPDASLTLVGTDTTQVLTNKDLSSATNTLPSSVVTLSGAQALSNKTLASTVVGQVADLSVVIFGANTARAVGTGDFPFGIKLQRAVTFSSVTFRAATADASGDLIVELRKNGTSIGTSTTTISAANQVAGGTSTGTWSFAAGDILTAYVISVGSVSGKGLIADIKGVTA